MKALVILAALAAFPVAAQETLGPSPALPPPNATPSAVNFSTVVGWPEGRTPTVPEGFEVAKYAGGLDYPRWLHVLPNGDVLVSEARTRMKEGGDPETNRGLIASRAMRRSSSSPWTALVSGSLQAGSGTPTASTSSPQPGPCGRP
jgi:glucose/arabinose dehydrogenase